MLGVVSGFERIGCPVSWLRSIRGIALAFVATALLGTGARAGETAAPLPAVDTALIVAVDISDSVDASRYRLQMEGIARALEDKSVISAITGGPAGAVSVALVEWADKAEMTVDWETIRNAADAARIAARVRALQQHTGEYTCMARMMKIVAETMIDAIPARAGRIVIDVSGDGIDNCDDPATTETARDALAARNITINGLPIIVKGENDLVGSGAYRAPGYGLRELSRSPDDEIMTLDTWYRAHVIAGPSAFLQAAQGYDDFGRAFRQKFVTEISALRR